MNAMTSRLTLLAAVTTLLAPGLHAFWKQDEPLVIERYDVRDVRFEHSSLEQIIAHPSAKELLRVIRTDEQEDLLVFHGGQLLGHFGPGVHAFWHGAGPVTWKGVLVSGVFTFRRFSRIQPRLAFGPDVIRWLRAPATSWIVPSPLSARASEPCSTNLSGPATAPGTDTPLSVPFVDLDLAFSEDISGLELADFNIGGSAGGTAVQGASYR